MFINVTQRDYKCVYFNFCFLNAHIHVKLPVLRKIWLRRNCCLHKKFAWPFLFSYDDIFLQIENKEYRNWKYQFLKVTRKIINSWHRYSVCMCRWNCGDQNNNIHRLETKHLTKFILDEHLWSLSVTQRELFFSPKSVDENCCWAKTRHWEGITTDPRISRFYISWHGLDQQLWFVFNSG